MGPRFPPPPNKTVQLEAPPPTPKKEGDIRRNRQKKMSTITQFEFLRVGILFGYWYIFLSVCLQIPLFFRVDFYLDFWGGAIGGRLQFGHGQTKGTKPR